MCLKLGLDGPRFYGMRGPMVSGTRAVGRTVGATTGAATARIVVIFIARGVVVGWICFVGVDGHMALEHSNEMAQVAHGCQDASSGGGARARMG